MLSEKHVEADGQNDEQEHYKRCLPQFRDVRIWMHQKNHFLDDAGELQPAARDASEPAKAGTPAYLYT